MAAKRMWSVKINLDEMNAAYMSCGCDTDRLALFSGFMSAVNGGAEPPEASNHFLVGFGIGFEARESTTAYILAQAKSGKASAASRAAKLGTAQPTKEAQPSNAVRAPFEHRSSDVRTPFEHRSNLTNNQEPITNKLPVPPLPPQGGEALVGEAKRKPRKSPGETLEQILGGGKGSPTWEAYWELVKLFGPTKNPAPKSTAAAYVEALKHADATRIHQKASLLSKSVSDPKYMPMLSKWLEGMGYLNPDPQPNGGNHGGVKTHHRSWADEAYIQSHSGKLAGPGMSSSMPGMQEPIPDGDAEMPF